jgi:hypothetical protein
MKQLTFQRFFDQHFFRNENRFATGSQKRSNAFATAFPQKRSGFGFFHMDRGFCNCFEDILLTAELFTKCRIIVHDQNSDPASNIKKTKKAIRKSSNHTTPETIDLLIVPN